MNGTRQLNNELQLIANVMRTHPLLGTEPRVCTGMLTDAKHIKLLHPAEGITRFAHMGTNLALLFPQIPNGNPELEEGQTNTYNIIVSEDIPQGKGLRNPEGLLDYITKTMQLAELPIGETNISSIIAENLAMKQANDNYKQFFNDIQHTIQAHFDMYINQTI